MEKYIKLVEISRTAYSKLISEKYKYNTFIQV